MLDIRRRGCNLGICWSNFTGYFGKNKQPLKPFMLHIMLQINTFFLFATMYQIFKSKRSKMTAEEVTTYDTVK